MVFSKVVHGFYRHKDAELQAKAQQIVNKMTGNSRFSSPTPALAEVQTAIEEYADALINAKDAGKQGTAAKNSKREVLTAMLSGLGEYVQKVSDGVGEVILSSGFEVKTKKSRIGVLAKPDNFKVSPGPNQGSMLLSVDAVSNARFYEFQFAVIVNGVAANWQVIPGSKSKQVISGLTGGNQYRFRVSAGGSDPARVWTNEISSFVL